MASRAIRGFLVVLYLSLSFAYNEGAESVGDLEIDLQLKILNKPYVKSIKVYIIHLLIILFKHFMLNHSMQNN